MSTIPRTSAPARAQPIHPPHPTRHTAPIRKFFFREQKTHQFTRQFAPLRANLILTSRTDRIQSRASHEPVPRFDPLCASAPPAAPTPAPFTQPPVEPGRQAAAARIPRLALPWYTSASPRESAVPVANQTKGSWTDDSSTKPPPPHTARRPDERAAIEAPPCASSADRLRKITGDLLSSVNPPGRAKPDFCRKFGFRIECWEEFSDALTRQAASHQVALVAETPYGPPYRVDGAIETPGRAQSAPENRLADRPWL